MTNMRSYIITTGVIFGLITLAHIWRIIAEWPRFAKDPFYLLLTVLTALHMGVAPDSPLAARLKDFREIPSLASRNSHPPTPEGLDL